jgi:hypothetical protein
MGKTRYELKFLFLLCSFGSAAVSQNTPLQFRWGVFCKNPDGTVQPIDYKAPAIAMAQGCAVKFYFQPVQNAYIYFYYESADSLLLLFPERISHFGKYYVFGKDYYVPKGDDWLESFDLGPNSRFHLIASATRLKKLEEATEKYQAALKSGKEVPGARQALLEEIKRQRLEHSVFKNLKEELVLVAGEFRGEDSATEFPAQAIEADSFYAATIRVESSKE